MEDVPTCRCVDHGLIQFLVEAAFAWLRRGRWRNCHDPVSWASLPLHIEKIRFRNVMVFALHAYSQSIVMKCTQETVKSKYLSPFHFIVDGKNKTLKDDYNDCVVSKINELKVSGWYPNEDENNYFVEINRLTGKFEVTWHRHGGSLKEVLVPPLEYDKTYYGTCQKVKAVL